MAENDEDFAQGVALVQSEVKALEPQFNWEADNTLALYLQSLGVTVDGVQLKNDGYCLGFTPDNFEAGDSRAQIVDCIVPPAAGEPDFTDDEIEAAKRQLLVAELGDSSLYKYYLRFICTDLVLKKVMDCETKDHAWDVYPEQCNPSKHFDIAVVPQTECVSKDQYNVDGCLFNVHQE